MILGDLGELGGTLRREAYRKATTAQRSAYTGSEGELIYDTDLDALFLMDGSTAGGVQLGGLAAVQTLITDAASKGFKATFGAGTGTVASAETPVVLASTTTAEGENSGWTVGSDNTFTATFTGTRICRVRCIFLLDVASGADALSLHIFRNGSSVINSADNSVTALTPELFEIDTLLEIDNGDIIRVAVENVDTTENVTSTAHADRVDTTPEHGYLTILG